MAGLFSTPVTWATSTLQKYSSGAKGPGVTGGGTLIYAPENGKHNWYVVYPMPPGQKEHFVAYQFDTFDQVHQTFGGNVANYKAYRWSPQQLAKAAPAIGSASEVIGLGGTWANFANSIMQEAAQRAGVRDPSLVGKIWNDPEMRAIAGQAVVGNWTDEQVMAAQRQTSFWKNTLYPGIENFYASTSEPEQAWNQYNQSVRPALVALGYQPDADGTFSSRVKSMLDKKIDAQVFLSNVPVFQQAAQNTEFFSVLQQRTQAELGKTIGFNDWFNLLAGQAAPDIAKVAEGAVLSYQAQQAGLTPVGEQALQRLIAQTEFSQDQAGQVFREVNQALIALGPRGLARGGLTRDELLFATAGIDPESGRSVEEVLQLGAKLAREEGLFDDEKLQFYVGFTPQGTPERPGLRALRGEGV